MLKGHKMLAASQREQSAVPRLTTRRAFMSRSAREHSKTPSGEAYMPCAHAAAPQF